MARFRGPIRRTDSMEKPVVVLARYESSPDSLRKTLEAARGLDTLGSGMRVLIKPNLLAPAPPEKAILTHPFLIKAAVEYVRTHPVDLMIVDLRMPGMDGRADSTHAELCLSPIGHQLESCDRVPVLPVLCSSGW